MSSTLAHAADPIDVEWTFRDAQHAYRAAPLDAVLTHCGFDAGRGGASLAPRDRRPGWRLAVVAVAGDGFCSVFTCAELVPAMGATRAFVAWARDGAPLPPDEGPLRIVVTTDQKGSRSARGVRELHVVDVVDAAAAMRTR